ncbi:lipid-binding SYLF domain-containing protein [Colwellia sp. D2M02]|uniref:lipid-binding SYLF domain-containing protein n=1 Tax=Colwellia sp. D2M02 TaxID=2841562 RepID=UPI001C09C57C|nr:lipid-binding SYLF domain-containing protein [Colwellia sp. D2M02]MBU2894935.1 lipid-binding SYLF domain-containing protein [Colwellia sp. D2M02]
MKKVLIPLITIFTLLIGFSAKADDYSKTISNFKSSPVTADFFNNAYGYAVYPNIGKGGVGIGAAHGSGLVYLDNEKVGESKMTQLSIGFQLGGQVYSQIIFFQDKRSFDEFTAGNFEFSADASAVALTMAAQAKAGTSGASSSQGTDSDSTKQNAVTYHKGMAVMTLAKGGLMYEAALSGQKYSYKSL